MITDEILNGLRVNLPGGPVKTALKELQLRRQLERYCIQTHPVTCDYYQNPFSAVCTCGLAELLAKLKELEGV